MDRWRGLNDFFAATEYWRDVQALLRRSGASSRDPRLYELPYLAGDSIAIPRGPGRAEDSDGYRDYLIRDDGDVFSIRYSGRMVGQILHDKADSWFGTFEDAAKYFVARKVAYPTRSCISDEMEIINHRWLHRGLAPMWAQNAEPAPDGLVPATRFYRLDNVHRFYFTPADDTATSFLLNLTWAEQIATFIEDVPYASEIPIPSFSDDR